jgi:hypothetical protein
VPPNLLVPKRRREETSFRVITKLKSTSRKSLLIQKNKKEKRERKRRVSQSVVCTLLFLINRKEISMTCLDDCPQRIKLLSSHKARWKRVLPQYRGVDFILFRGVDFILFYPLLTSSIYTSQHCI